MKASPKDTGISLTVATWNVHYGIGRDNRFDMDRVLSNKSRPASKWGGNGGAVQRAFGCVCHELSYSVRQAR